MGDVGEDMNAWREQKNEKKRNNREYSTQLLIDNGVAFEEKNGGAHLIVESKSGKIDFWPSTGLYMCRESGRKGRGVRNLLKVVGIV
jgi:hypothetical protein